MLPVCFCREPGFEFLSSFRMIPFTLCSVFSCRSVAPKSEKKEAGNKKALTVARKPAQALFFFIAFLLQEALQPEPKPQKHGFDAAFAAGINNHIPMD